MSGKIKDCPFDGGNHLEVWGNYSSSQVVCMRCGAKGPKVESYRMNEDELNQKAIQLWNERIVENS
jgi:hypothetical protein